MLSRVPPWKSRSSGCCGATSANAAHSGAIGAREPSRSQTVAPTQPPGRVTRAISDTPPTGSVMKCTTRHAPLTSNESSS